jgi:FKBP-type peptidyl-prolyl cis-trans isomerase
MTRISKLCLVSVSVVVAVAVLKMSDSAEQVSPPKPRPMPKPEQESSYALGVMIGQDLKSEGVQLEPLWIAYGLIDALRGDQLRMNEADLKATLAAYQKQIQARRNAQIAQIKSVSANNRKAAAEFLAANGKKPGVMTLPSGLQYQILRKGTGPTPAATNTVKVHYHGTLANGTVFDSSVKRGQPLEIPLNQVIQGWTEGVTKMKVGGKWRLFVPPDLAYGDSAPPGGPIGPGMLLIFEVELLGIVN